MEFLRNFIGVTVNRLERKIKGGWKDDSNTASV